MLLDTTENLSAFLVRESLWLKADVYLEHGEVFKLAGFSVKTLVTMGHTEGSCCYWIEEEGVCLKRGDTLFYGSCGRTDLPTGA